MANFDESEYVKSCIEQKHESGSDYGTNDSIGHLHFLSECDVVRMSLKKRDGGGCLPHHDCLYIFILQPQVKK